MENQLLKQLYSQSIKLVNDQVQRDIENFEKADKIIIWIVGFLIGIFALVLTRSSNNPLISRVAFEITLSALLTVILGLSFRTISFFTQMTLSNIVYDFISFSTGYTNAEKLPTPREILATDDLDEIIYFFEVDFGLKMTKNDTTNYSNDNLNDYRELYKNYYETLASSNNSQEQLLEFYSQLALRFGLTLDKVINSTKSSGKTKAKGVRYQILLKLSYISFFLTILNFILGMCYFAYCHIVNGNG